MSNQTWYLTNPSNLANLAQKLADPTPLTISDRSPSLKPDSNGLDDRFEHKKNDFQPTWLYVHWKSSCSPPMGVFRRRFSPISRDLALSLRDPSRSHWDLDEIRPDLFKIHRDLIEIQWDLIEIRPNLFKICRDLFEIWLDLSKFGPISTKFSGFQQNLT